MEFEILSYKKSTLSSSLIYHDSENGYRDTQIQTLGVSCSEPHVHEANSELYLPLAEARCNCIHL